MSKLLNKDKLYKDYYQCIQATRMSKRNGDFYLKIKLINKDGVIDGFLWNILDVFEKRVRGGDIYAIKAKKEIYNKRSVLNIKSINPVSYFRYKKYGYNKNNIIISKKKMLISNYIELIDLVSKYSNSIIRLIKKYFESNKQELFNLHIISHKLTCIKHIEMLHIDCHRKINLDLSIIIILLDRIHNADSLMLEIEKIDKHLYKLIQLYKTRDKEFIKKYKYIVDLITYNLNNEKFFKNN